MSAMPQTVLIQQQLIKATVISFIKLLEHKTNKEKLIILNTHILDLSSMDFFGLIKILAVIDKSIRIELFNKLDKTRETSSFFVRIFNNYSDFQIILKSLLVEHRKYFIDLLGFDTALNFINSHLDLANFICFGSNLDQLEIINILFEKHKYIIDKYIDSDRRLDYLLKKLSAPADALLIQKMTSLGTSVNFSTSLLTAYSQVLSARADSSVAMTADRTITAEAKRI